ncbi:hypothetical protein AB834_06945 [PVC group bacterium (ex Bugula neritina AB1)]|nr:hypothetical protein AB834_06945 [PVC group bacterium (ex Bugula neritina AB1)]
MEKLEFLRIFSFLGAAMCMGLGAIGPAIGAGNVGAIGLQAMAKREDTRSGIMKVMLVAMAIASSSGIYALVIGVLLLYFEGGA